MYKTNKNLFRVIYALSGCFFLLCGAVPLFAADGGRSLTPRWRQAMDGTMLGPPLVEAELITVVSDGGTLRSYSTWGNPLWIFNAQGRLSPYLGRSPDGTTYICKTSGVFIAINRSGRELWRRNLGEPLAAPPLPGWDGRVFLFTEKHIRCYNAAGYSLWQRNLESPPVAAPVMNSTGGFITTLENGQILEGNAFGKIQVREPPPESVFYPEEENAASQKQANTLPNGEPRENPPRQRPLPQLKLAVPLERGTLLLLYHDGNAVILPLDSDALLLPKLEGIPATAAGRGNHAAVMLTNGKLVFISGGSGTMPDENGPRILWSAETHTGTIGPGEVKLICDERIIFVLSKTGISGFSRNGEKSLSFNLRNISSLPALSEDGSLYAGGNDWILYAYQTEDDGEEKRSSQRNTGSTVRKNYGTADPRLSTLEQYPYHFEESEINRDLKVIDKFTRSGDTGEYERLTVAYLMEIATGLREHTLPRARGGAPISPHYRAEALRLLGYLGSRETIPFLAHICSVDPEPAVRAAAATAIGRIGVDPDGIAFRSFTRLIYPPSPTPDDQVLLAVASAIGSICRFSGPPLSETGTRLLVALESRERSLILRRRALEELARLK